VGFGLITDLVSRSDGLYVMNLDGDVYRIATLGIPGPPTGAPLTATAVPEPSCVGLLSIVMILVCNRLGRQQRI